MIWCNRPRSILPPDISVNFLNGLLVFFKFLNARYSNCFWILNLNIPRLRENSLSLILKSVFKLLETNCFYIPPFDAKSNKKTSVKPSFRILLYGARTPWMVELLLYDIVWSVRTYVYVHIKYTHIDESICVKSS